MSVRPEIEFKGCELFTIGFMTPCVWTHTTGWASDKFSSQWAHSEVFSWKQCVFEQRGRAGDPQYKCPPSVPHGLASAHCVLTVCHSLQTLEKHSCAFQKGLWSLCRLIHSFFLFHWFSWGLVCLRCLLCFVFELTIINITWNWITVCSPICQRHILTTDWINTRSSTQYFYIQIYNSWPLVHYHYFIYFCSVIDLLTFFNIETFKMFLQLSFSVSIPKAFVAPQLHCIDLPQVGTFL